MRRRTAWKQAFTNGEIEALREVSDAAGMRMVVSNVIGIALALALVAVFPNPLTIILALFVIGARQLGLAVVMHEASHRTLFRSRRLNDFVGNWLAAYWLFLNVELYRPYHLAHHAHTGTERDPDLNLRQGFPTTKASVARKVTRDLLGVVGVKRLLGTSIIMVQAAAGRPSTKRRNVVFMGQDVSRALALRTIAGFVVTQGSLLGLLWVIGTPWLFAVWFGAWMTTQNLVVRLRSIAEHAMTELGDDPFRNTRTIRTRWWERLLIAPNGVAFHLEHHLLMTVPAANLPRFHRMLEQRGLLDDACVEDGYVALLRRAASRRA